MLILWYHNSYFSRLLKVITRYADLAEYWQQSPPSGCSANNNTMCHIPAMLICRLRVSLVSSLPFVVIIIVYQTKTDDRRRRVCRWTSWRHRDETKKWKIYIYNNWSFRTKTLCSSSLVEYLTVLLQTKNTVFLFESFNYYIFFSFLFHFISICLSDAHPRAGRCSRLS